MITCPWCGSSYTTFQTNCDNCGAPLPQAIEWAVQATAPDGETLQAPPPSPRKFDQRYAWKLVRADGWFYMGWLATLLGLCFAGAGIFNQLVLPGSTGPAFFILGIFMAGYGALLARAHFRQALQTVEVLRNGTPIKGEILEVKQNTATVIRGQNPWIIKYNFDVSKKHYKGQVSTLNPPRPRYRPGATVMVLYLASDPRQNTIYPHP